MATWIHRMLKPHCPECREERENSKFCASCETLRVQLERANYEKDQLLSRLLAKPEPEPIRETQPVTPPRIVPWGIKRQMLEAEDREKARLMREAPKPIPTDDLEKEMKIVADEREARNATK